MSRQLEQPAEHGGPASPRDLSSRGVLVWEDPPTHHLGCSVAGHLGDPTVLISLSPPSASWVSSVTISVETSRSPDICIKNWEAEVGWPSDWNPVTAGQPRQAVT